MTDIRQFLLPDLGEGLTEADIVAWHVVVGDRVALNQVLAEVETEKAGVELPSPFAGTVTALLAEAGSTVAVGSPIISMEVGETAATGSVGAAERIPVLVGYGPSRTAPSRRRRGARHDRPIPSSGTPGTGEATLPVRPLASPPVRFMARQAGIDLAQVPGHGPGGVITRDDLAAHLAAVADRGEPTGGETRTPVRGVHKRMAEAMVRSVTTAPQACVFLDVDVTETVQLVERFRSGRHFEGIRVTPLAVVAKAVLVALREYPALNSSWDDTTGEIVLRHDVHLGVAVAAPRGLLVPSVKRAHALSLRDLARALGDVSTRAREGTCTPNDLTGGTFTITNVGVFGVDGGVPILNPGEAGILAVGAFRRRPWEHSGAVALREVATLTLTFDHRLVDGETAARFLVAVGEVLTDPSTLIALG